MKALKPLSIAVQAGAPVLAIGEPGIGKTSAINALGRALDAHVEVVIASLREPADFAGLPVIVDGTTRMAPPRWARRLAEACQDGRRGLLFLDELTTAPPAVQAALLRVVLDRVVGELALPESVSVVAAANPPEQAAGGWELSAPLSNRFVHLRWTHDPIAWVDGMLQGFPAPEALRLPDGWQAHLPRVRAQVAGFIRHKPQSLLAVPKDDAAASKPWPSPRSWDMAARLIAAAAAVGAPADVEVPLVAGCIGEGVAMEYLAWRQALDLPDPEYLLSHPDKFELPKRGDQAFTALAAVAAAAATRLTRERYLAAWKIFNAAARAGQKDVAAASVKALAAAGVGRSFLQDREVREAMKNYLQPFLEILKAAGLA